MIKSQRIKNLEIAFRACGISANTQTIDLIIELNDLVLKHKGKADLMMTSKILADNQARYPIIEEAKKEKSKAEQKSVFIKYPKVGKCYQHYKGGEYEVLTLEEHSETGEKMVSYKSVGFGSVHTRPLSMWFEKIEGFGIKNKPVYRFTEIKSK